MIFNHYFTKSKQDWKLKLKKGTVSGVKIEAEAPYTPGNRGHKYVKDRRIIEKFSLRLHERMEKLQES